MYDTVRLAVGEVEIDPARLLRQGRGSERFAWQESTLRKIDGEDKPYETTVLNLVYTSKNADRIPHHLSYRPGSQTLIVETSLPKVIYPDNVSMLAPVDVARALDELSNRIDYHTATDLPHCGDWGLRGRLDAVFNWRTGAQTNDYLHAAKQMRLARHRVEVVDQDSTVYFKARRRWLRFYDKYAESGTPQAKGILRFETEMKQPRSDLKRFASVRENPKAREVLNWQTSRAIQSHWLNNLGVDLVVTDTDKLFNLLLEHYKPSKAARLISFVALLQLRSRDELLSMGFKRMWLWRQANEIKKLGAQPITSQTGLLPALRLPEDYDGSPGVPG